MAGTEQRSGSGQPLDSLTSLRFFAALAVVLFHFGLVLPQLTPFRDKYERAVYAGPTGVGFFFILSGFVLTWSLRPGERPTSFYRRRAARVLPNHVLLWAVTLVILLTLYKHAAAGYVPPTAKTGTLSLLLLNSWVPSFSQFTAVNNPSWSLCCEAFFYALFPLIAALLSGRPRQIRRGVALACLVGIAAIAFASPTLNHHIPANAADFFVYHFPPARLLEFVLGVVAAMEVAEGSWRLTATTPMLVLTLAAMVGLDAVEKTQFYVLLVVVPFTALIATVATRDKLGMPSWLRSRWLIRGGQWSFALYLVHWPTFLLISYNVKHIHGNVVNVVALVTILVLVVALSAVVFQLWERPLERRLRAGHRLPVVTREV